jgi:hypothetical protein
MAETAGLPDRLTQTETTSSELRTERDQARAQEAQDAAEALRRAGGRGEEARKARGRLRRACDGWRGR